MRPHVQYRPGAEEGEGHATYWHQGICGPGVEHLEHEENLAEHPFIGSTLGDQHKALGIWLQR